MEPGLSELAATELEPPLLRPVTLQPARRPGAELVVVAAALPPVLGPNLELVTAEGLQPGEEFLAAAEPVLPAPGSELLGPRPVHLLGLGRLMPQRTVV